MIMARQVADRPHKLAIETDNKLDYDFVIHGHYKFKELDAEDSILCSVLEQDTWLTNS